MINCAELKSRVESTLLSNWQCEPIQGQPSVFLITTASVLPNNDCVELMVELGRDEARISDNGCLYNFFLLCGVDIADKGEKLKSKIVRIIENYKVEFSDSELQKRVPVDDLALGLDLVISAIKDASSLVYTTRPVKAYEFKEKVFAVLAARQASVTMDYPVTGRVRREHIFDLRLNDSGETLARTISTRSPNQIRVAIERAWYAFNDAQQASRIFEPAIVYDDSTPETARAWHGDHLEELKKLEIQTFAFVSDREELLKLAERHRHEFIPRK